MRKTSPLVQTQFFWSLTYFLPSAIAWICMHAFVKKSCYGSDMVTVWTKGINGQDAGRYKIPEMFVQQPTPAVTITPSMSGTSRIEVGYQH